MTRPKTMPTNAKRTLTPKLRFPEFRGALGWQSKVLHAISEPVSERADSEDENNILTLSGEHGLVLQSEYFGKQIAGTNSDRYFRIQRDDFVYNDRTTKASVYGTIKRLTKHPHGVVSPIYKCFRFKKGELPGFWAWYFESGSHEAQLRSLANEGARAGRFNVSIDRFLSTGVWAPDSSSAEQQRVADCLSTLDEVIGAESQKLNALNAHKKELMQQLFPREGEILPRLRFSRTGVWEIARLPDVTFFQEGPGIMAADFRPDGVPLIRLAGLGGLVVTLDGCNYLDPEKVRQKWGHFRLAINDLVVSTSATFGRPSIVSKAAVGAVFYTGLIRFRSTSERLKLGYLEAFLGSPTFLRQAELFAAGMGIKHFGPTHLKQMQIPVPPPAEQERIASFFTNLDGLIAAQSDRLEALKIHKKGLMQQLFPSPADCEA